MTHDMDENERAGTALSREAVEACAYVDGAMDDSPQEKAAFEERLGMNADLRERVTAYRKQNERLQDTFGPLLHKPVPESLYFRVERQADMYRAFSLRSGAIAAALMAICIGVGWVGARYLQSDNPMVHEILGSIRNKATLTAILTAPQGGTVTPLSVKMANAVPVERLKAMGLTEIERSVQTIGGQPALIIDYRTVEGGTATLMVQQRDADAVTAPSTFMREDDFSASVWTGDTIVYTLISPTEGYIDIKTLTQRIRGGSAPKPVTVPQPPDLTSDLPVASDMPQDHLLAGQSDIPAAPNLEAPSNTTATPPDAGPNAQNL